MIFTFDIQHDILSKKDKGSTLNYSRYFGLMLTVSAVMLWFLEASTSQLSVILTHYFPQFGHVGRSYVSPIDGMAGASSEDVTLDIYLHSGLFIMLFFGLFLMFKPSGSLFATTELGQQEAIQNGTSPKETAS